MQIPYQQQSMYLTVQKGKRGNKEENEPLPVTTWEAKENKA